MSDKKVLDLILNELKEIKTDVSELKTDVSELKTDVSELKTTVNRIDNNTADIREDMDKGFENVHESLNQAF
jgi:predicted  nucleic acid-binding Zn-ribbon protein